MPKALEGKIKQILQENDLSTMETAVLSTLIPYVQLQPQLDEGSLAYGVSKIGGTPDFPKAKAYPETPGKNLTFLAQYNLRELAASQTPYLFPKSGMLYFFVSVQDLLPNQPLPPHSWKVCYLSHSAQEELFPVSLNEEIPREWFIPEQLLTFYPEKQLPDVDAAEEMNELYFHLMEQLYDAEDRQAGEHQAFGQPLSLSGDVLQQAATQSGILEEEWLLLLQIDLESEDIDIQWGHAGLLYFCIPRRDLANAHFDRVWLIYQAH